MTWSYKWGDKVDFYYKLQAQNTLRAEDVAPNVEPFGFYIEAFQELSTCRSSGFGISAIPFIAIVEYAKLYGMDEEDFEDFLYVIRAMDSELIRLESKKQGTKNGSTGNKRNNS